MIFFTFCLSCVQQTPQNTVTNTLKESSVLEKFGILPGDILLEVNNEKINSKNIQEIINLSKGNKINIKILRNGENVTLAIQKN